MSRATHAAGWKADPTGLHLQRWWDGRTWTDEVVDTDPLPVSGDGPHPNTPGWYDDPTGRYRQRFADEHGWTDRVVLREPPPPSHPKVQGWHPDPLGSYSRRWWNGTYWTHEVVVLTPLTVPADNPDPPIAGWHLDPGHPSRLRRFDGVAWTDQVTFDETNEAARTAASTPPVAPPTAAAPAAVGAARPGPPTATSDGEAPTAAPAEPHVVTAEEQAELDRLIETRRFITEARRAGEIDQPTYSALVRRIALDRQRILTGAAGAFRPEPAAAVTPEPEPKAEVTPEPAAAVTAEPEPTAVAMPEPEVSSTPEPAASATPEAWAAPTPAPTRSAEPPWTAPTAGPAHPTAPPPAREVPSWTALARAWIAATLRTIRSDLAIHGLAYLGVVLLFAGVFGFVAFAFGDVGPGYRPVAEVAIPTTILLASWFLRRKNAPYVADALELVGGAILPVVAFASLVDGSAVPPDLTGGPLEAALLVVGLAIAGVYGLVVRTRPTSMLRFVAAPTAWLAVMMGALVTEPALRGGNQIAQPFPWETAVGLVAVLVTTVLARRFAGRPLADATEAVALPGLVGLIALQIIASADTGWPVGPTLLAGFAALGIIEIQHRRLGDSLTVAARAVVATGTIGMLAPHLSVDWIGAIAVVTFLALAETGARRYRHSRLHGYLLVPAAAGLAFAAPGAWAAVTAFTAATAWAHVRRLDAADWVPAGRWPIVLAAGLPIGISAGLFDAAPDVVAVAASAGVVLGVALATRFVGRRDAFWTWWTPTAVTATLTATVYLAALTSDRGELLTLSGAAAALTVAVLLSRLAPVGRIWAATVPATVSVVLLAAALDLDPVTAARGIAVLGLVLVAIGTLTRSGFSGDAGLIGHLLAITAYAIEAGAAGTTRAPIPGGLFTAGWLATTVALEVRGSAITDRLGHYADLLVPAPAPEPDGTEAGPTAGTRFVRWFAPIVLVLAVDGGVADTTGTMAWDTTAVALAVTALVYAAVTRLAARRHPLSRVLAGAAYLTALIALPTRSDTIGALTALGAMAVILLVPPTHRAKVMMPTLWIASGLVAVRGALAVGLPNSDVQIALFAWGAVITCALLAHGRLRDPDRPGITVLRDPQRLAPFTVGVAALGFAMVRAAEYGPGPFGRWTLGLGAVLAAWAVLADAPWITLGAFALGTDAAARLLPWPLPDRSWNLAVALGLTTAAAALLARFAPEVPRPRSSRPLGQRLRWSVWPFAVANGTAATMVSTAELTTTPAGVYLFVGTWALAVGTVIRRWPWALVGIALIDLGATRSGPDWLTLGLLATSATATAGAVRSRPPLRTVLQFAGAIAFAGAGASAADWLGLEPATAASLGGVVAGLVVVAVVTAVRFGGLDREWLPAWGGVGLTSLGIVSSVALATGERSALTGIGIGIVLVGIATALAIPVLGGAGLGDTAAFLVAGGIAVTAYGLDLSSGGCVAVAVAVALVAVVAASLLAYRQPASAWLRPLTELAVIASVASVGVALTELPDRWLLVPALAAAGVYAALLGVTTTRSSFTVASPVILCAAWLTYATEALTGNPDWLTVPIGITILVIGGFLRAALLRREASVRRFDVIALDYVGMTFVTGAAIVQTVTNSLAYALIAIVLGAGLTAWGAVTRVRRRAAFGVASTSVALVLLIGIPLTELAGDQLRRGIMRGAGLWLVIAAAGLVVIVLAAFLEQGRRRVRSAVTRIGELTRDWE